MKATLAERTVQQHRCIQRGKERGDPSLRSIRRQRGGVVHSDSGSSSRHTDSGCDPKLGLLYLFSTKALKALQATLLLYKAIWDTFIINQPFFFFSFFFFSTLDTQTPPPVLTSVPTENSVYQDRQPKDLLLQPRC